MEEPYSELSRILDHEERLGYEDKAVEGGLAAYAPYWNHRALQFAESADMYFDEEYANIALINQLMLDYGYKSIESRHRTIFQIRELLSSLTEVDSNQSTMPAPNHSVIFSTNDQNRDETEKIAFFEEKTSDSNSAERLHYRTEH